MEVLSDRSLFTGIAEIPSINSSVSKITLLSDSCSFLEDFKLLFPIEFSFVSLFTVWKKKIFEKAGRR